LACLRVLFDRIDCDRVFRKAKEAKERYWKVGEYTRDLMAHLIRVQLHLAGKTEEARSDLARLKIIKEEREAARAKREATRAKRMAEAKGPCLRPPISCPNIDSALLRTAKAAEIEAKKAVVSRKSI